MTFQATVVQKKLEEAGFEPKLAFGITAVLERDVVDDLETRLVTKEYLDARLAEMRAEIRSETSKLQAQMSKLQGDLQSDMSKMQGGLQSDMSKLQAEMSKMQAETRVLISELRSEMIKWFVAIVGGVGVTVLLAVLRMTR